MRKKEQKKAEFSKIWLILSGTVCLIVTLYTLYMVRVTGDLSPLTTLITVLFGDLGIGTAFYYNKAKAENRIKLKMKYGIDAYSEESGDEYERGSYDEHD